ncbi:hypothetical protein RHMOL_Rhmol07G0254100 [Rhododendron molle]|uniref:Uncharacterized protein n=1 Tax=Rhododendron molle TaxID=49168 RepID=A0ACC0N5P6_RHOML|nr:hypothetical protein RHMOL_Rhmol07G0254100 [Rhododendron molle]
MDSSSPVKLGFRSREFFFHPKVCSSLFSKISTYVLPTNIHIYSNSLFPARRRIKSYFMISCTGWSKESFSRDALTRFDLIFLLNSCPKTRLGFFNG